MKTKVIFKKDKGAGDVFTFFPDMDYNVEMYGTDMKTCYAHVGQHSACHVSYVEECSEAQYYEYYALLQELIGQGYRLEVLNTQLIEMWRKPTEWEIKLGEGAIHYRSFPINEVLNKQGNLKIWITAKDDGLRYTGR